MSGIRVLFSAIACSFVVMPLAGCWASSTSGSVDSKACLQNLDAAYSKLEYSKARGYSGKLRWAKAEGVLAEAKAEQEVRHYNACVAKVKEAEPYIQGSSK